MMTVYAALAVAGPWPADRALLPGFVVVTGAVSGFFLGLTSFVANPFARIVIDGHVTRVAEGNGLNPLLQHPGMAFHPPTLYLGFTGLVIPYAFGMAALAARRTDAAWIRASRRWMLIAWAFLSIGLALGALGGGGSILTVPALVYLLGQSPAQATSGSLVIVGVSAALGMAAHARAGKVRLAHGFVFGLLGTAGSLAGSSWKLSIFASAMPS